jgi:hypothetical protein
MILVKKTRGQIKKELQEVINILANMPCTFWACPGPNKPITPMATCRLCQQVKRLRQIKKEI